MPVYLSQDLITFPKFPSPKTSSISRSCKNVCISSEFLINYCPYIHDAITLYVFSETHYLKISVELELNKLGLFV